MDGFRRVLQLVRHWYAAGDALFEGCQLPQGGRRRGVRPDYFYRRVLRGRPGLVVRGNAGLRFHVSVAVNSHVLDWQVCVERRSL